METVNFSLLDSRQTLTFGQRIVGIYKGVDGNNDTYSLAPFVSKAKEAYTNYSAAYERESKNPFTILLAEKDSGRDSAFIGFRKYVEACSYSEKEGWSTAATKILEIIKKYGWSASALGYKAETAAITGMIDEIQAKCSDELALLLATEWFQYVVITQADFEQTQKESVSNTGSEPTILETRPTLIKALRSLVSFTELQYTAHSTDTELAGYIGAINELITLTMTTARANDTRRANDKKKTEAETSQSTN